MQKNLPEPLVYSVQIHDDEKFWIEAWDSHSKAKEPSTDFVKTQFHCVFLFLLL